MEPTSSASGTTYFKSAVNPLLNISCATKAINFNNLEFNITATSIKGVSVVNDFVLNIANTLSLVNGDIKLTGESQLVQTHLGVDSNVITSGKIILDQQGYASSFKYNYWSSPINNSGTFSLLGGKFDGTDANVNPFSPKQILFNTAAPYSGLPSIVDGSNNVTTPLTISTRWIYKYVQGAGVYKDWVAIDQNSLLNPGEGYTMKDTNPLFT